MNLLDIAQNSVSAGAKNIDIEIGEDTREDRIELSIADDGRGMTEQQLKNVTDPFYTTRTTRKVGLGIPFLKMAAEMAGGDFSITSTLGVGTVVRAGFVRSHIDRMPLGDLSETMSQLICLNEHIDIHYTYRLNNEAMSASSAEFKQALDGISLATPQVMQFVREYIEEHQQALIEAQRETIS